MELKMRVMKATLEEFEVNGIKFTMDTLSAKLGVSKRTIYEQLGNKEDIIEMLIEEAFTSIKEQEKKIVSDDSLDIIDKLKGIIQIFPALSAGVLDYRRVYEIQKYYPKLYTLIETHLKTDWETTVSLIEEGIRLQRIKPIPILLLKEILFSMMNHLLKDRFLLENNLTYEQALKGSIDILFNGIIQ